MSLYIDTSAVVPIFIREQQTDRMIAWVEQASAELIVADLTVAEFRSQMSRRVRKGELPPAQADQVNTGFDRWREAATAPLEHAPADIRAAARMVRIPSPKLLTPDAVHIATCRRLGFTLVTYDRRLIEAAGREGVQTVSPG